MENTGNPTRNPHLPEDLFYDEESTKYSTRAKLRIAEAHRVRNFTYENKARRDDWEQRSHFEEADGISSLVMDFTTPWRDTDSRNTIQQSALGNLGNPICLAKLCVWWGASATW